jgi:hypothetical protein
MSRKHLSDCRHAAVNLNYVLVRLRLLNVSRETKMSDWIHLVCGYWKR